jgi:hypothetical protein
MKRLFTILSVTLVVVGLIGLASGDGVVALGLLAIGMAGIGIAAYHKR